MRYDEFDDYNNYSRGSSRRGSSSYSSGRDPYSGGRDPYQDRYDERYSDRYDDRSYSRDYDRRGDRYDRYDDRYDNRGGYDRYEDRGGYDRYDDRGSYDRYDDRYDDRGGYSRYDDRRGDRYDRYDDRRGDRYSDRGYYGNNIDLSEWERTAPNWDDRNAASSRSKQPSRSSSRSGTSGTRSSSAGGSSSRSGDYNRSRPSSSGSRSGSSRSSETSRPRRTSDPSGQRRSEAPVQKQRSSGSSRPSSSRSSSSGSSVPSNGIAKRLVPFVLSLVLIVLAVLIIKSVMGGGKSDYAIEFSSQTIVLGETTEAKLTGIPEGEDHEITWSSGDSNVVSVEGEGTTCTITAEGIGQATVAASIDGRENAAGTVVVERTAPGVTKIEIDPKEASVKSGEEYTIKAKVIMEKQDMSPAKISWESSDEAVARVSDEGVVTARNVGTAVIKASAGEKTAEFVIKVVENGDSKPAETGMKPSDTANKGAEPGGTVEGGGNDNDLSADITGKTQAGDTSAEKDTAGQPAEKESEDKEPVDKEPVDKKPEEN